ncbi:hypothetical protein DID88_007494 [Monilinia fructigena]|uniref:Uncharacterized protein n=1 Tax=Monilinia fructigena TaxID=38457 RepID=A0A395J2J9_9HELO|nr:hypothetical protein DID88_007494 [Monilinia fructigena]
MKLFTTICLLTGITTATHTKFNDEPKAKGLTGLSHPLPEPPPSPTHGQSTTPTSTTHARTGLSTLSATTTPRTSILSAHGSTWNSETAAPQPIRKDMYTFQLETDERQDRARDRAPTALLHDVLRAHQGEPP